MNDKLKVEEQISTYHVEGKTWSQPDEKGGYCFTHVAQKLRVERDSFRSQLAVERSGEIPFHAKTAILRLEDEVVIERDRFKEAERERDEWRCVVQECEKLFKTSDTAESGLMSNLPNLIRNVLGDVSNE